MLGKNFSSVESYATCGCACSCKCSCASGTMIKLGKKAGTRLSLNYRSHKANK